MSMRSHKRRRVRQQSRAEVFDTFDLCTGEYAGTYYCWRSTRPRKTKRPG